MRSSPRLRASSFVLASGVAAALVLSAPFVGYVRAVIRARFPGQFVRIVGGAIGVLAVAGIGAALLRIRDRRALRYTAIAGALALAVWSSVSEATGVADVDVVQRFHFVEYGLITFLFYRAWRPLGDLSIFLLPVLAGLLVGTADEWLQWFIPNRVGEMADIFLNGIAIACGLAFSAGADPPPEGFVVSFRPASLKRFGRLSAAFILAFAAFFHTVHLGYDIADEDIGVFKSRYSKPQLAAMVQDKAQEWRAHPLPLVLQRASREDQYLTEGLTHVQERNKRWAAEDAVAAWKENQILERYYALVLDTPSYVSRTGHRWSAEQRAQAEARANAAWAGVPYVSAANPYPIFAWSRALVWAGALGLAAACLLIFRR